MKLSIRLKHIIFSMLLLLRAAAASQNKPAIVVKTFIKQDTVLLRWAPTTAGLFIKGLRNGYTVERAERPQSFDGPSKTTFIIPPFSENAEGYVNAPDQTIRAMAGLINELATSAETTESTQKMAFSILMLSAAANKELAKMLGVYYEDLSAQGNTTYVYRIRMNHSAEMSDSVNVNTKSLSQHQPFTTLSGSARPKLHQAYLSWEASSLQEGYSAYWIERSTDSVHFERRNDVPYLFLRSQDEPGKLNCDFADSSVVEGVTYYYRVTGISHFAETGRSSNIVKVYVPVSIYGECRIDTIAAEGLTRKISGKFLPAAMEPSGAGNAAVKFVLFRSDSALSGYRFVAEKTADKNSFCFEAPVTVESGDRYYYKVIALSADSDTVYSFPYYFFTLDQVPPSMPQNLTGIISDSGIVSLTWTANPESDIRGYRIFRSNDLNEEFTEVTRDFCTSNSFYDTLRLDNLTPTVYYRMTAVDLNFNNSETCPPVLLLKPDTIPPVEAVFRDYAVLKSGVALSWYNSTSADLEYSLLLRYGARRDTLLNWPDTTGHFFDSTAVAGESYLYLIVTSDQSGNTATSNDLPVHYEPGVRTGIAGLKGAADRSEKHIALSWVLPEGELYSIQVYRAKNDEPFRLVKTIRDVSVTGFIDKDLAINNVYQYKIKVVYASGISSLMCEPVVIVY